MFTTSDNLKIKVIFDYSFVGKCKYVCTTETLVLHSSTSFSDSLVPIIIHKRSLI